eukprot:1144911-Rhodomonas_salina.1
MFFLTHTLAVTTGPQTSNFAAVHPNGNRAAGTTHAVTPGSQTSNSAAVTPNGNRAAGTIQERAAPTVSAPSAVSKQ